MRVLLCGGGTAGHVMPAIAIGEIIEKSFPGSVIAFAGRDSGDENRAYEATGHRLYTLEISGIKRSISINNIKSIIKLIKSGRIARGIIKDFHPDLIIGTGGYVCYPFIRQGQRLGVRTAMHESNVFPGLVTRLVGMRCDSVMLNLEGTKKYLKASVNTAVVGNPTRASFGAISKLAARKRLGIRDGEILVVSFGGSLGAELLNKTMAEMILKYTVNDKRIRHIHSTGRAHYEAFKNRYPELLESCSKAKILPYIDDMPTALTAADLAITRSGAITVSELCRCGTPSILIPSPNVTANHQFINADYVRAHGAARMIEEKELSARRLFEEVRAITESPETMRKMTRRSKSLYTRDTEKAIAEVIKSITQST